MKSTSDAVPMPNRLFLGVRRDAYGRMVEEWADPKDLGAETQARERLKSLVSLAGVAGVTGNGLGRLLDTYGYKFDGNLPISRRGFLRATAAVAATGAFGCEGNPTSPPGLDPDQTAEFVRAIISGPSEVEIPSPWGVASVLFDSKLSTGGPLKRYWKLRKDQDPFGAPVQDLGDRRVAQADFVRVGDYTLELRVVQSGESSTATHQVTVVPPPPLSGDYPRIGFYRHVFEGTSFIGMALYLMDPASGAVTRLVEGAADAFIGQKLTWEKGGQRLATDLGSSRARIGVYNLLTDGLQEISRPEAEFSWIPSWNPQKDWIAYSERLRASYYEPVLVRPDGSERIYLAGDSPDADFSGHYSSWSPDGDRLALAETPYNFYPPYSSRRISIFDGIWSGNTFRTQVPTEEQLLEFLEAGNDNDYNNRITLRPGINGLALSPDGEWLVYTLYHGFLNIGGAHQYLVRSRVDGTGSIRILTKESVAYPLAPTFSPSGGEILFAGGGDLGLYKMSFDGSIDSQSTLTGGGSGGGDTSPTWYH